MWGKLGSWRPQKARDLGRVREDKAVDVFFFYTPNHWHALAAIWAMQAGKDVYVEKPVSHCVWEGRQIVKAARKHSKIVQTGTQVCLRRAGLSAPVTFVHVGHPRKILVSSGLSYNRSPSTDNAGGKQKGDDRAGKDIRLVC